MFWIRFAVLTISLVAFFEPCQAKEDEPGWSIMIATIAKACGAPAADIDQAAGYIAEWAARNLDDPSRLTKEKTLELIQQDTEIEAIVSEKHEFIYPCDRWVYMLGMFNESKGSVMGGNKAQEPQEKPAKPTEDNPNWYNYDGQCWFKFQPKDSPISIVNVKIVDDPEHNIEISLWINVDGLSSLGDPEDSTCRFYDELAGSMLIGDATFKASRDATTACDPGGDKIGADSQSLSTTITGEKSIADAASALANETPLRFKVENGPRTGTTFEIPTNGLKGAIRSINICPAAVRDVLEK